MQIFISFFSYFAICRIYISNKTVSKIIPKCRSSNQTDNEEKKSETFLYSHFERKSQVFTQLNLAWARNCYFFLLIFFLLVCSAVWKESFRLTQNSFVIIGKLKRIWTSFEGSFISYFMCVVQEKNQQWADRRISNIFGTQFLRVCVFFSGAKHVHVLHEIREDNSLLFMMIVFYLVSKFTHRSKMSCLKNDHIQTTWKRPFFMRQCKRDVHKLIFEAISYDRHQPKKHIQLII